MRKLINQVPEALIVVEAILRLKSTEEGGRKTSIQTGYWPNHVFDLGADGKIDRTYMGEILLQEQNELAPAEEAMVSVRFIANESLEKRLTKGRVWWIYEGPNCVGDAIVL